MVFHQIQLKPDSRDITFVYTQWPIQVQALTIWCKYGHGKIPANCVVLGVQTCMMIFELLVQTTRSMTRTWKES